MALVTWRITNQRELRRVFWRTHPEVSRRKYDHGWSGHKDMQYTCDTRTAFVDFVDRLQKGGVISSKLADRVAL